MRLSRTFIQEAIPQALISGPDFSENISFAIDSRTVKPGQCFVALAGERVDGHDFIEHAITSGATGVFVAHSQADRFKDIFARNKNVTVISVPNTYDALITLARAWREKFSIPCIGVTGSVGKTSTKELLGRIMSAGGKNVILSPGNHNTDIGCSMAILSMRSEHDVAIFEMGISHAGEMKKLASLVQPTIGIITTIGHSHMAGLGSFADIAREKRAIFSHFVPNGIGVINGDIPALSSIAYQYPMIKFGRRMTNQIQARKIVVHAQSIRFVLKIYGKKHDVVLPTPHEGMINNVLAATAVAQYLEIDHQVIIDTVEKPFAVPGRFEKHELSDGRGIIINDCYNASPESMKEALVAFDKIEAHGAKVAVLGDMLELGVHSPFWHRQLGRILSKAPSIDRVIFVGEHSCLWAKKTAPFGLSVECAQSWQEAQGMLQEKLEKGDAVLVKASRGVGLDRLVKALAA